MIPTPDPSTPLAGRRDPRDPKVVLFSCPWCSAEHRHGAPDPSAHEIRRVAHCQIGGPESYTIAVPAIELSVYRCALDHVQAHRGRCDACGRTVDLAAVVPSVRVTMRREHAEVIQASWCSAAARALLAATPEDAARFERFFAAEGGTLHEARGPACCAAEHATPEEASICPRARPGWVLYGHAPSTVIARPVAVIA